MRISDWSSDVCSSDLEAAPFPIVPADDAVLPHCDDVGCSLPDPRQPHAREDGGQWPAGASGLAQPSPGCVWQRSEEHTSELQSLMRISYAVFCLKKKNYRTCCIDLATLYANTSTKVQHGSNSH